MIITYLAHSGFLIEWDTCYWLFDYSGGRLPRFDVDKRLIVFVSHSHQDHYNPEIFGISAYHQDVIYVLSNEIFPPIGFDAVRLGAHESLSLNDGYGGTIKIKTMKSTDIGIAFLINYCGKRIYFAGDLNWWLWENDTPGEAEAMRSAYLRGISELRGLKIDAAFVPLDPRLGKNFYLGIDRVMKIAFVDWVFPMHMWGDYAAIDRLMMLSESKDYRSSIVKISREGQSFEI